MGGSERFQRTKPPAADPDDPDHRARTGGADPRRWGSEGEWWGPAVAVDGIGC